MKKKANKVELNETECNGDVHNFKVHHQEKNHLPKQKNLKSKINNLTSVKKQKPNFLNQINKKSNFVSASKNKKISKKIKNELNKTESNRNVQICKKNQMVKNLSNKKNFKCKVDNLINEQKDSLNDSNNDTQAASPPKQLTKTKKVKKPKNSVTDSLNNKTNLVVSDVEKVKSTANNENEKVSNLQKINKKKRKRSESHKMLRKKEGQFPSLNRLSVNEMKERIVLIRSREKLSKTALRKLRVLKKKVQIAEAAADIKDPELIKNEDISPNISENKKHPTKDIKENQVLLEDRLGLNKIETKNCNDDEEKVLMSNFKKNLKLIKKMRNNKSTIINSKSKTVNHEKTEEDNNLNDEIKATNDNEENSEEDNSEEDNSEEDNSEEDNSEEDNSEDEDSDKLPLKIPRAIQNNKDKKSQNLKQKKNESNENNKNVKNKRYVLFVGNLSLDTTTVDLKKHFLSKVSKVKDVRIPLQLGTNTPRGFAYVEVENNVDYEKALSLHQTFIKGKQINVQYTLCNSKEKFKKQDVVHKNKKLHALRKVGKLAGTKKKVQKRNFQRYFNKTSKDKSE